MKNPEDKGGRVVSLAVRRGGKPPWGGLFLALVLGLVVVGTGAASAQQNWNAGSGNWSLDTNWTPFSAGIYPDAVGGSAGFLLSGGGTRTITVDVPVTLGTLTVNATTGYTISSGTLTLDNGASAAAIVTGGAATKSISSALAIDSDGLTVDVTGGTLTLSGTRSGAGDLVKTGSGTLTLSGATSFSGNTQIAAGTLNYNTSGALAGGSTVTVGDGVGAASSAVLTINTSMRFPAALAVTLDADGRLNQGNNRLVRLLSAAGTGEIALNSSVGNGFEFMGSGAANDSTFSGTISGGMVVVGTPNPAAGSRINKTGTSTLTLDGPNSYVARTFVSGGALRAASDTALGSDAADSGTYVYSAGSLELDGGVTLSEIIAINGSGAGANGALRAVSGTNSVTTQVQVGWAGGSVTAQDASVGAANGATLNLQAGISGNRSLTKVGEGTVRLGAADARTGTFSTSVDAGTLALAAAGGNALAGTALTLNAGGTLLLEAANQIADATGLVMAGGIFDTGAGFEETLGTLTLSNNSLIDLGTAAHLLTFANSSGVLWNPLATLTISGWSGSLISGGAFGKIYFGAGGLSLSQLANVTFSGYAPGAQLLSSGELVPAAVPEPGAILGALVVVAAVGWRERGRLKGLVFRCLPG